MADNPKQTINQNTIITDLRRDLENVKQLAPLAQSSESYTRYIQPFLFGKSNALQIEAITDGLATYLKNGKLTPSDSVGLLLPTFVGSNNLSGPYQITNSADEVFNRKFFSIDGQPPEKKATEYLFYSDIISILFGITRFFLDTKSAKIANILDKHSSSASPDGIKDTLSDWGDAKEGKFIEHTFEVRSASNIHELFEDIIAAAKVYEQSLIPLDESEFVAKSELLSKHLAPKLAEQLETEFYSEYKARVEAKAQEIDLPEFAARVSALKTQIAEHIQKRLSDSNFEFFGRLFTPEMLGIFEELRIYSPNRSFFLPEFRERDKRNGVLETEQYQEFVEAVTPDFLQKLEDAFGVQLQELLNFVKPQAAAESAPAATETAAEDQGGAETTQTPTSTSINLEQLRQQLVIDATTVLLEQFFAEEVTQRIPAGQEIDELITQHSQDLYIALQTRLVAIVPEVALTQENSTELTTSGFMGAAAEDDSAPVLLPSIFESSWYQTLITTTVAGITQDNAQFFTTFYQEDVAPLLSPPTTQTEETTEAPAQPPTEADLITPPAPITPISEAAAAANAGQVDTQTTREESQNLREEINREFQFKVEVLVAQASKELFGKELSLQEIEELSPEIINALRNEIIISISSSRYAKQKLKRMGLNAEEGIPSLFEQDIFKAVREFAKKHPSEIDTFKQKLESSELWQKLSTQQQERVRTSFGEYTNQELKLRSAQDSLKENLAESLNFEEKILLANTQNSLDAVILQHGVELNEYDALWLIENAPISRLAAMLSIPSEVRLPETKEEEDRFRRIFALYARERIVELMARAKNKEIARGLQKLSSEDARKLLEGDSAAVASHGALLSSIRKSVSDNGAEETAGGLTHKKNSRKKTIEEQFKTFVPLWFQLSPEEQLKIYAACDIPVPKGPDYGVTGYPFIGEFVFFDITKLRDFSAEAIRERVRQDTRLSEAQKLEAEVALANLQNEEERKFAEVEYDNFLLEQQQEKEDEYFAYLLLDELYYETESEEHQYYKSEGLSFDEGNSYQDLVLAQQIGTQNGKIQPSLLKRIGNRVRGKKKQTSAGKLQKTLGKGSSNFKKRSEAAWAIARAGANILPGVGLILSRIKNKAARNWLTAAVYGFVAGGIAGLATTWGKIGAAIGGFAGSFTFLGPIGGALIGSNIGLIIHTGIESKGLVGFLQELRSGIGSVSSPGLASGASSAATAAVSTVTAPSLAAASSNAIKAGFDSAVTKIAGLQMGIGTVAPLGAMLFVVFVSIYTVFMIQASFLVPVPASGRFSDLPPGLSPCWPVSGQILQLPSPTHVTGNIVNGEGQAFDIAGNNLYPIYAAHDGIAQYAYMQDANGDAVGYGNYVKITSPKGYITIYAHMSNVVDEIALVPRVSITRGTLLGYVGSTGYSTGPHLHYEYSGGLIRSIVPNGQAVSLNDMVSESCSTGGTGTILQ